MWWQKCRSVPAGCLWTEGWEGCAPVGSGYALSERCEDKCLQHEMEQNCQVQVYDTEHKTHLPAGAGGAIVHGHKEPGRADLFKLSLFRRVEQDHG